MAILNNRRSVGLFHLLVRSGVPLSLGRGVRLTVALRLVLSVRIIKLVFSWLAGGRVRLELRSLRVIVALREAVFLRSLCVHLFLGLDVHLFLGLNVVVLLAVCRGMHLLF